MIDLQGKKTLITGGSRGIGKATAVLFSQAGSDVALNYQSQKEAANEVKGLVEANGQQCLTFKADVSQEKDVNFLVDNIMD